MDHVCIRIFLFDMNTIGCKMQCSWAGIPRDLFVLSLSLLSLHTAALSVSPFSLCFIFLYMVAAQADSQDDHDFCIGNLPEGLNVSATNGPPTGLSELDHLSLKQDVDQFGLAGKIWQR